MNSPADPLNGKPNRTRDAGALAPTGPADLRGAVDETQSGARQDATTPNPRLPAEVVDELDRIASGELDAAWTGFVELIRQADGGFDAQAAYTRLAKALPAELASIPLVARQSTAATARSADAERRNLILGLAATGLVCAGLATLAYFGSGLEPLGRRPKAMTPASDVAVPREATSPTRSAKNSSASSDDSAWDEEEADWDRAIDSLTGEFEAERRRVARPLNERRPPTDAAIERVQGEVERLTHDLEIETRN